MPVDAIAVLISAALPVSRVTAVALTTAKVFVSIVFRSAAAAVPASTVTPTAAAMSIPVELIAVAIAATEPVSTVTDAAPIATVVLPSKVFSSSASTVVLIKFTR